MASWQFYFSIVEKTKMQKSGQKISEKETDKYLQWSKKPTDEAIKTISTILSSEKSWSNDIYQYGLLDDSCVEVFKKNKKNFEISCRISLHNLNIEIVETMLNFAKSMEGALLVDNILYDVTKDNLIDLMLQSKACKICKCSEAITKLKETKQ